MSEPKQPPVPITPDEHTLALRADPQFNVLPPATRRDALMRSLAVICASRWSNPGPNAGMRFDGRE